MENKNISPNLLIRQLNQSNALGFDKRFIAGNYDVNFDILGKAFRPTGKIYAALMMNIENNNCTTDNCEYEYQQLKIIKEAPANAIEFLSEVTSQLAEAGTSIVTATPNINELMLALLPQIGLFDAEDIQEDGELTPTAKISEEFVLKNPDGSYDYEIVDIGNGKGRNVLQYDMDKITRKAMPFIEAEVAGLLSQEQEAVALWNVYIAKGTSVAEDAEMVQNANAASESWSYEEDLPLSQDKKVLFERKYISYFMNNYLSQFLTNQLPTVEEDASVFDLEEGKKAKVEKFMQENNI